MTKESQKTNTMTAEETARQNSFIELAKTLTAQKSNTLGRPLTYCLTTFGCQMNEKQSEVVAGIMDEIGYHRQDNEEADVVIYNTCTVRENANLKVYGRLGHLHSLKDKNPDMKIILFGCMMQEPHVVEKIKKTYPFVNLVFGTHNIFKFAELFYDMQQSEQQIVDIWEGTDQIVEDLPTERNYTFKSGVNIMFGCNNFCSYCIVPYVRGRERSREPEAIVKEVKRLAADGVSEVMLLGQNVNSYGKTLENPVTFAQLLDVVAKCGYDTAFTFLYSKRSDTPAAAMENQVPQDVAKERFNRLLALVQQEGRRRSSRFEGSVQEVLVEEESKEKGIFTGRTEYNLLVHFPGNESLLGKYVRVHLDECRGFYYLGTLEENE